MVEVRILRRGRPLGGDLLKLLDRHPGMGGADDLFPILLGERLHGLLVAGEDRVVGRGRRPLGMVRGQRLDAVDGEDRLTVDRMLDPETAILIEGGDAILDRDEPVVAFIGRRGDEVEDRLSGRAVVPGGQRIVLGGDRRRRPQARNDPGGRGGDDSAKNRAAAQHEITGRASVPLTRLVQPTRCSFLHDA